MSVATQFLVTQPVPVTANTTANSSTTQLDIQLRSTSNTKITSEGQPTNGSPSWAIWTSPGWKQKAETVCQKYVPFKKRNIQPQNYGSKQNTKQKHASNTKVSDDKESTV